LVATILVINKEISTQTKKKRRPARSVVAYHEAGHAIACHTLGSRVLAVSVIPDYTPWGIDGDGYCLAEFPSSVDGMAMLMAGEMAQLRFEPKSEGAYPFAGDEHKVERILTAMVNRAVAELNLTTEDARYEFVSQLERRCKLAAQREATDIVDRHWLEIETVARALIRSRFLDRTTFLSVLADCRRR
jgi:ATP-dependent Zn protease